MEMYKVVDNNGTLYRHIDGQATFPARETAERFALYLQAQGKNAKVKTAHPVFG